MKFVSKATYSEYQLSNSVDIMGVHENFPINIAYHHVPNSKQLIIIVPGVDGSHIGYKNKYLSMANKLVSEHSISVLRTSNPFISGLHWDNNFHVLMEHVSDKYKEYKELIIFGFSAGASTVAEHSWKYQQITKIILVNLANDLHTNKMIEGLKKSKGDIQIVYGDEDENKKFLQLIEKYNVNVRVKILDNCDHYFSGNNLSVFIDLPSTILRS